MLCGRANGGLFARVYPFARLFGIDTVTPDTQMTSSGGIPIGNTGLAVGGANLIPVKVDATVEYDLLSDFGYQGYFFLGRWRPFSEFVLEKHHDRSQVIELKDTPRSDWGYVNNFLFLPPGRSIEPGDPEPA